MNAIAERITTQSIAMPLGRERLHGELALPANALGVVMIVHGSGSGRHCPRNHKIAVELAQVGLATLFSDLLTAEEEAADIQCGAFRCNIPLLAIRVSMVNEWLNRQATTRGLPVGHLGAGTGAAAALMAAAENPGSVAAVVSRGGRPDLAGDALENVWAPTMLIVGSRDESGLRSNYEALRQLGCKKELHIIEGATHLFEEPGALKQVAHLAAAWFQRFLVAPAHVVPLEVW